MRASASGNDRRLDSAVKTVVRPVVQLAPGRQAKEPLINLRIMAHCGFDSRATVWTGS